MKNLAVQMDQIVKIYPNGVLANDRVDFSVEKGEIHALVGENGAGKTTLMKILFGIEEPTDGSLSIGGNRVSIHSVAEALKLGLGMVQQHFMLVPSMTVAENILLGDEPVRGALLDQGEAIRKTRELCKTYSFDMDVGTRIDDLSVGDKQKVEILKVLYRQAQVIILDEPTAVLTPQETEELFRQLRVLKEHGHTIVFISHKLREIKEICDRVTIMRSGRTVGTYPLSEISVEQISEYMMGQQVHLEVPKPTAIPGAVKLKVQNVSYATEEGKQVLDHVSFDVRSGEILGIVGVEGNGQKELVEIISGNAVQLEGSVFLNGQNTAKLSIRAIRDNSFSYVPQERMSTGIAADCSITENMFSVAFQNPENRCGVLLDWKKMAKSARESIQEYLIKTDSDRTAIRMLSGGNIQKVVVAREFMGNPQVIVAEQPTRGIDVGAANLIHRKLVDLRSGGSAVLLVSSDLSEILTLSDSILVLYNGKIVAYFPDVSHLQESDLGFYMLGVKHQTEDAIGRCRHE